MTNAAQLEVLLLQELGIILDKSVEPQDKLVDLGLDSFAIMQIIAYLEDTFGIEIPEERLPVENFYNVRVIAEWVQPMTDSAEASQ